MVLKLYNTLTRKVEPFEPGKGNKVNMFVCGPTVYDYSHLGHARTYTNYDILARWLRKKGFKLFYLMNITDVDDKIIARAQEEKVEPLELSERFTQEFYKDMKALGNDQIDKFAKASDYIKEIIAQAQQLIDKDYAYITSSGVYYDITKFSDYGKLSKQPLDELKKHRVEPDPEKRNVADFSLWKKQKPDELAWDATFKFEGKEHKIKGRPGWHIEDTAITVSNFGPSYDLHGGATELIFPHHEAEIAQAEAATGVKPLVRFWVHSGLLNIEGQKMAKSLKNFIKIREALEKYDLEVLRLFFANAHYRSQVDFATKNLEEAKNMLDKLRNSLNNASLLGKGLTQNHQNIDKEVEAIKQKFEEAMDNDLNTHEALACLFELSNLLNKYPDKKAIETFKELASVFGILQKEKPAKELSKELKELIEQREKARKSGDFKTADKIRKELAEKGILLEDTPHGATWKFR